MPDGQAQYPVVPSYWWQGYTDYPYGQFDAGAYAPSYFGISSFMPQWMRQGASQYGYPEISESDYFAGLEILGNSLVKAGILSQERAAEIWDEAAQRVALEGVHSGLPYYAEVVSRRMPNYLAQSQQEYQNQLLNLQGQYPYGNLSGATPQNLADLERQLYQKHLTFQQQTNAAQASNPYSTSPGAFTFGTIAGENYARLREGEIAQARREAEYRWLAAEYPQEFSQYARTMAYPVGDFGRGLDYAKYAQSGFGGWLRMNPQVFAGMEAAKIKEEPTLYPAYKNYIADIIGKAGTGQAPGNVMSFKEWLKTTPSALAYFQQEQEQKAMPQARRIPRWAVAV
jgi:hypothetical protein